MTYLESEGGVFLPWIITWFFSQHGVQNQFITEGATDVLRDMVLADLLLLTFVSLF